MNDLDVLRAWMEETYTGLQEKRSTAAYALEFLKTERRNAELWASRALIKISLEDVKNYREWHNEAATKSIHLADKILELEKLKEAQ